MDSQKIRKEQSNNEYYTIDVMQILRALWHKAWALLLAAIICGGAAFCYSNYFIAPRYTSSIMLYVNNSSFSLGNTSFSISSSEISAAQSLVKTYAELLNNRTTLERVIKKSGLDYDYKQLSKMIVAEPANETEIMRVTVIATGFEQKPAAQAAAPQAEAAAPAVETGFKTGDFSDIDDVFSIFKR